jgi:cytochrome c556
MGSLMGWTDYLGAILGPKGLFDAKDGPQATRMLFSPEPPVTGNGTGLIGKGWGRGISGLEELGALSKDGSQAAEKAATPLSDAAYNSLSYLNVPAMVKGGFLDPLKRSYDYGVGTSKGAFEGDIKDDSGEKVAYGNPSLDAFMAGSMAPVVGAVGGMAARGASEGAFSRVMSNPEEAGAVTAPLRAYHAMSGDLEGGKFNLDRAGQGANAGLKEDALFFTSDPSTADSYLNAMYRRGTEGEPSVVRDYAPGGNILPVDIDSSKFDVWDMGGAGYRPGQMSSILQDARNGGVPGVVLENYRDPGISGVGQGRKQSTVAVFQPGHVKSATSGETLFSNSKEAAPVGALSAAAKTELPMDEASRMARAREMGYTIDAYHGTNQPIQAFDPSRLGSATRSDSSRLASFFTDSPDLASSYADNAARNVVSNAAEYEAKSAALQAAANKLERIANRTNKSSDWSNYEKAMADWEAHDTGGLQEGEVGQSVLPVKLRMNDPAEFDAQGGHVLSLRDLYGKDMAGLLEDVAAKGHDGAIFRNLIDTPSMSDGTVANHYAVFNPSNIRSRFAAFDPARSNSSDLLAANAPDSAAHMAAMQSLYDRLPERAFAPSALPMDEASRMGRAKEMGFDTDRTLYHGTSTPDNFESFRPSKDGYNELGTGAYFFDKTDAPGLGYYSGEVGQRDHGRVIPTYAKGGDYFDFGKFRDRQTNARERMLNEAVDRFAERNTLGYTAADKELIRTLFDDALARRGDINPLLKEAGYVGGFDKYSQMPDQVVIFDPKNVRSKFATFDPSRTDSPDIMAANAPGAALPLAAAQSLYDKLPERAFAPGDDNE